jgi:hypothetical protein
MTGHSDYWRGRGPRGKKPKFDSPEKLWDACVEYFEFVEANPLLEDKAMGGGEAGPAHTDLRKMRAMTIAGMCTFIGCSQRAWQEWAVERADLKETIELVDQIIRTQKFEGAAAGMLNPVIIARDLGLTEKSEITGKDGKDLVPETSAVEVARRLAFLLAQGVSKSE